MSRAACVKKTICDHKATALSRSGMDIVFKVLVPALEAGEITEAVFKAHVYELVDADEVYITASEVAISNIEAMFTGTPSPGP